MAFFNKIIRKTLHRGINLVLPNNETQLLALGALLSKQQDLIDSKNLNDYEFKIFSQWVDDGIIQYLIKIFI